jgi:hypothetical protein
MVSRYDSDSFKKYNFLHRLGPPELEACANPKKQFSFSRNETAK